MKRGRPTIKDPKSWDMMMMGYDVQVRNLTTTFVSYEQWRQIKLDNEMNADKRTTEENKKAFFTERAYERSVRNRYERIRKWRERGSNQNEIVRRPKK